MATSKLLPHLHMSKKGDGEGGGDGQNRPERISDQALTKNDLWKLQFLATSEAKVASTLLNKLTEEDPERSLSRSGMIIDTDPRHMGGTSMIDAPLPGLPGGGKGKTDNQGKSVSYVIPEQAALEEQAMQDRILYEMRQNLAKLKEYGRQLGIAFDVSKKKSRGGRMQGEKWVDDEMELWKKQATRLLKGPEDLKPEPEDEHRAAKMEEMVFKMERLLNDVKYVRICKQRQHDALDNELNVTADMEAREQSGDGKMAAMMAAVAILREKIQDTDQKLGEEEVGKRELTKVHDDLYGEYRQNQNKLDDVRKALDNFGHDSNQLRLQLKDKLHDIEKVLGQGKLLTMAEIKEEMQTKYGRELDSRQKVIQKQIKIKEMLRQHEARARELTKKLQSQYDPNKDSPRRNELKRKALAFEEVFDTMMQRIGESDITKIVDLFQKQSFTCNAWMEAVRDQEVRVKALLDEKALLDTQLQRVSAKKPQGSSNETRQYTITGRRLDMATERCETSNERLMQLDGLIAHIKESVRMALIRVKDYISDTEVPPLVFPDDGEGGLLDWVDKFATQVATLVPTEEQYKLLAEYDSRIELPPEFRIDESNPYGLSRPHTARTVDLRTADKAYAAAAPKEEASAEAEGTPETPVVPQTPVATSDAPNAPEEAAAAAPPSPEKNVGFTETAGSGEAGHAPEAKAYTGIYVSMPAKLKVAIRMAPDDVTHDGKEEDETEVQGGALNMRIAFPPARNMQKNIVDKEREEDEQEARAEHLDETIVSRDEHKRRAMRLIKQKEREKAEKEALEMGEVSVSKKKKKGHKGK